MLRNCALVVLSFAVGAGAVGAQPLVVRASATPCLRVRSMPQSGAQSLVCILPGTVVTGDSAVPFWRRVRTADGTHGWAAKKFLDTAATTPGTNPAPVSASSTIPDSAWMEIHIIDVGQGDGIWITTHDDGNAGNNRFDGRNIVIDGGPDGSDARNEFLKYLRAQAHDGAVIDGLIVTHPHNDHYPGARGILQHFDVCHYYDPGTVNGPDFDDFLIQVDSAKCGGAPIVKHRGLSSFGTPEWGTELGVDFLWGGPIAPAGMGSGGTLINNNSVVFKLTYGTQSFLFLGDAEGKERHDAPAVPRFAEKGMLDNPGTAAKLRSTVLKLAHHGSETSSTLPFIAAVNPEIIIVSSGRRAFSGTFLPDSSTLRRYCTHNPAIRIYRTDQNDAAEGRTSSTDADGDHIVIRTNGARTIVEARSAGQPFTPADCAP